MMKLTSEQEYALMELHRYNCLAISALSPAVVNVISALEREVSAMISRVGGVGFVKCGKKSCMDYAVKLENRNTKRIVEKFVAQADKDLGPHLSRQCLVSDILSSTWCQTLCRSLAVTTGFDAIQTLSSSLLASFSMNPQTGSYLFVHRFLEFDPCLEFRCFVVNRKVTGITQVNAIYSKWLNANATAVSDRIVSFIDTNIIPKIEEHDSYCVDLIATAKSKLHPTREPTNAYRSFEREYDLTNPSIDLMLLRIHPFIPRTVTGLFEWGKDKDILTNGPVEFRCKRQPSWSSHLHYDAGAPLIARYWVDIMNSEAASRRKARQRKRWACLSLLAILLLLASFIVYFFFV